MLTPGTRLYSAVSDCEVVVVRPPGSDIQLACGGETMIADPSDRTAIDDLDGETLIGKRYSHPDSGLEVLCTKGGSGQLAVDGTPLERLDAKPLPSSD